MTRRLRIGVVGCGEVAVRFHLPAVARSQHATLAAVVDSDAGRASEIARRFGARYALVDYRDLVGRVDAAVVATPNHLHASVTGRLLQDGIDVMCEKPIACTVNEAREMIAAARSGPGRLTVAHNCRFTPAMQEAKRLVDAGYLGALEEMSGAFGAPLGAWKARTDFRGRRELAGGGVLIDLGIHLIDLACWMFGEPVAGLSYEGSDALGCGTETDADVALEFGRGGRALVSCSATHTLDRVIRLRGSEGWIRAAAEGVEIEFFGRTARACRIDGPQRLLVPAADSFTRQLDHFCDALLHDRPFLVTPEEALRALEVVAGCYAHARAA